MMSSKFYGKKKKRNHFSARGQSWIYLLQSSFQSQQRRIKINFLPSEAILFHSVIKIIFCLIYSSKNSLKWDCIFMQCVCQMGNTELGWSPRYCNILIYCQRCFTEAIYKRIPSYLYILFPKASIFMHLWFACKVLKFMELQIKSKKYNELGIELNL